MNELSNPLFWMKGMILLFLVVGMVGLAGYLSRLQAWTELLSQTLRYMDDSARRRLLENRKALLSLKEEHSRLFYWDRELDYSGWKRKIPGLTVENWLVGNVLAGALLFGVGLFFGGFWTGLAFPAVMFLTEWVVLTLTKQKNLRSTHENLMKFLDFLGNYSITAGELTSVFFQVSRYLEDPLKGALEECYYEAQTTGDTAAALLVMGEKLEHPKCKELIRNLEIGLRYSADFSILVQSSRRSMREYLRTGGERKSLLREGMINMLLLLGLSLFIFFAVDKLIELSIWQVLFATWPGRIGLGILAFIFFLFGKKMAGVYQ